jgi:hypothetical protein
MKCNERSELNGVRALPDGMRFPFKLYRKIANAILLRIANKLVASGGIE